jgi:hypothetical protein
MSSLSALELPVAWAQSAWSVPLGLAVTVAAEFLGEVNDGRGPGARVSVVWGQG